MNCIALQRHVLCRDEMRAQEALETARSVIVRLGPFQHEASNDLTYRVLGSAFGSIFNWLQCPGHS